MPDRRAPTRYAIVGAGSRAEMFAGAISRHPDAELVALADVNRSRLATHARWLAESGAPPVTTWPAADFDRMLDAERVDRVVVTTVDRYHDDYIVAALDAGRAVLTEKPMTIDERRCRRILDAVDRTGGDVTVTFNYRYNPVHERVRELLAGGAVGEVLSVHFEWLLDTRHGADYFRRWHRDTANSGGLMVHKASHHFDLVNWWIDAVPEQVYGIGRLAFYGEDNGARHGHAHGYERAHGAPAAEDDPFALRLADSPKLTELYLSAEDEDGYLRDRNVFAPGITIQDDMALVVRYSTGATMTYHLTAYSPWEGYRLMVNGSEGRLELQVVENDHVSPALARTVKGAALHGADAPAEHGDVRLTVHPFWAPPRRIEIPGHRRDGHGGADDRMAAALLAHEPPPDPLVRKASAREGALALLTGLAANRSFASGAPVLVRDVLDLG
ncbi:MAG TPA: Gfo/Idh/MocA family oxidoreductase [Actinocatenispora sp.]